MKCHRRQVGVSSGDKSFLILLPTLAQFVFLVHSTLSPTALAVKPRLQIGQDEIKGHAFTILGSKLFRRSIRIEMPAVPPFVKILRKEYNKGNIHANYSSDDEIGLGTFAEFPQFSAEDTFSNSSENIYPNFGRDYDGLEMGFEYPTNVNDDTLGNAKMTTDTNYSVDDAAPTELPHMAEGDLSRILDSPESTAPSASLEPPFLTSNSRNPKQFEFGDAIIKYPSITLDIPIKEDEDYVVSRIMADIPESADVIELESFSPTTSSTLKPIDSILSQTNYNERNYIPPLPSERPVFPKPRPTNPGLFQSFMNMARDKAKLINATFTQLASVLLRIRPRGSNTIPARLRQYRSSSTSTKTMKS